MEKYKAVMPKDSNGFADIYDKDNKATSICTCWSIGGGIKLARRIAKALNAQEKAREASDGQG